MSLAILFDAENKTQDGLLDTFLSSGRGLDQSFVRGDKNLALTLRPVIASNTGTRPWDDDHTTGDTYQVAIGNPDSAPESGTFTLELDGDSTTLTDLPMTAANIATGLSTAAAGIYGDVQVTLLSPGVFQAIWDDNGAVPQIDAISPNNLNPDSQVFTIVDEAGDATTRAVQFIILRQSPVAYAEPSTAFASAAVTATVTQTGSGSANKIYTISMTAGTYGGSFSLTVTAVTGSAQPLGLVPYNITAADFATLLATQTVIASTANVSVTRAGDVITVEFIGTQKLSNVPVIAVTNQGLLAPKGVSGTIQLNTTSLFRAFWATSANTLTYTLAVRRTRATGEEAEIFQHPVTLKRNIIDVTTMAPVLLPSYLTEAQSDARYVPKAWLIDTVDSTEYELSVVSGVLTLTPV